MKFFMVCLYFEFQVKKKKKKKIFFDVFQKDPLNLFVFLALNDKH